MASIRTSEFPGVEYSWILVGGTWYRCVIITYRALRSISGSRHLLWNVDTNMSTRGGFVSGAVVKPARYNSRVLLCSKQMGKNKYRYDKTIQVDYVQNKITNI